MYIDSTRYPYMSNIDVLTSISSDVVELRYHGAPSENITRRRPSAFPPPPSPSPPPRTRRPRPHRPLRSPAPRHPRQQRCRRLPRVPGEARREGPPRTERPARALGPRRPGLAPGEGQRLRRFARARGPRKGARLWGGPSLPPRHRAPRHFFGGAAKAAPLLWAPSGAEASKAAARSPAPGARRTPSAGADPAG